MGNGRPRNTAVTFWRHVNERGPDECWPWKISTKNGYGRFSLNCVEYYAHRFAYELAHGNPPKGRETHVMHTCNNKLCCNPRHLTLGTAAENTQSAFKEGLAKSGQRHHNAKFSRELIAKIKNDPRPQLELQRIYGVSQQHISRIKNGHSRKHEAVNG